MYDPQGVLWRAKMAGVTFGKDLNCDSSSGADNISVFTSWFVESALSKKLLAMEALYRRRIRECSTLSKARYRCLVG